MRCAVFCCNSDNQSKKIYKSIRLNNVMKEIFDINFKIIIIRVGTKLPEIFDLRYENLLRRKLS
jgi:hypothetical protein